MADPLDIYLKPLPSGTAVAPNQFAPLAPETAGDPLDIYLKPSAEEKPSNILGNVVPGYDPQAGTINGTVIPSTTQNRLNRTIGFVRGAKTVLDTAAHGLAHVTSAGADWLASKGIISPETAESINQSKRHAIIADQLGYRNYQAQYGNIPGAVAGEVAGNIAASAPIAGPVFKALGQVPKGANLIDRLVASTSGSMGAGATVAGLLSSAGERPTGEQIVGGGLTGAGLGFAAIPTYGAAKYVGGLASRMVEPFTERGREAITNRIIAHFGEGGPAQVNPRELIPGSTPTLAQATANPGIATLERSVKAANPNPFIARAGENAAARANAVDAIAGDKQSLEELINHRTTVTDAARDKAFEKVLPVDPAPALKVIDDILASPSGKRDVVARALTNLRSKIEGEIDPKQLYGVRQSIGDMLSPLASGTGQDARLASSELMKVRDAIDPIIESGAPGFRDYLKEFHELSKPINQQEFLQGLKLTDAKGNITLGKVDAALARIEKGQSASGIHPAKSLHPDAVETLHALREDLRQEQNSALGKPIESGTMQNIGTNQVINQISGPLSLLDMAGGHPITASLLYGVRKAAANQNYPLLQKLTEKLLTPTRGINALRTVVREPPPPLNLSAGTVLANRLLLRPPAVPEALYGNNQ